MPTPLSTETFVYTDSNSNTVTIEIESYTTEVTASSIEAKLNFWRDIPLFKQLFDQIIAGSGSSIDRKQTSTRR